MFRSVLILVAVSAFSGQAFGQGEVVSYYADGGSSVVIVPSVPAGGFVMTDFILGSSAVPNTYVVKEDGVTKLIIRAGHTETGTQTVYSFTSGVSFAEGSAIQITTGVDITVAICGYIPAVSGTVPAVSTWAWSSCSGWSSSPGPSCSGGPSWQPSHRHRARSRRNFVAFPVLPPISRQTPVNGPWRDFRC